jgi:hypothetical protein
MASLAVADAHVAALRFVGLRVDDVAGARIGRVEAILVDRERGTAQWLHVRLAGFSGAYLALPLDDVSAGGGHLHFPYQRAHLLAAPRVNETGALTSRIERQLCEFYAINAETRGAAVTAWERRSTSARLISPGVWEPAPRRSGVATAMPGAGALADRPRGVRHPAPASRSVTLPLH